MATISATTKFDLSANPKRFLWIDTTDWAGQGIPLANVNGSFKVTAPSGTVIYNNVSYSNGGCDIHISSSLNSQHVVSLPLTISGLVESGVYTIVYTVFNSVAVTYYTQTYTFNYTYVSPVVSITQTADCVSPLFTSTDYTNYAQAGATLSLTRIHTLFYPNGSAGEGSPVVTSLQTLTTGTFYNGTQTSEIASSMTYTFTDGLIVIDAISGAREIQVDCVFECNITCCIKSYESQMWAEQYVNQTLYETMRETFSQIMGYVGLVKLSIQCGLNNDITGYLNKIKSLAHCTDGCCGNTQFSQVVGLGFPDIQVTVVSDSSPSLTVTPTIVGSTTEYHVALSDAILNIINNPVTTILNAGHNITLNPVTVVGNVTTYTVNGLSTIVESNNTGDIVVTDNGLVNGVQTYGLSLQSAYTMIYNDASRTVNNGSALPFTGTTFSSHFTHTANSTDIVAGVSGIYQIVWTVLTP